MAFDPARFLDHRPGHGRALGLTYRAHGEDWAELIVLPRPELMSADGDWATGVLFTLADVATAMAVWLRRGAIGPQVTLDLRLDRLRAGSGRALIGRGECLALDSDLGFVRGAIHEGEGGDPIALVTGSFVRLAA